MEKNLKLYTWNHHSVVTQQQLNKNKMKWKKKETVVLRDQRQKCKQKLIQL